MRIRNPHPREGVAAGFILPAILIVASALFLLAVAALLVAGSERRVARAYVNRQRAELAARAGLEDIRGLLNQETANDHFVVVQGTPADPPTPGREATPELFLACGKLAGNGYAYRYLPLFSTHSVPEETSQWAVPPVEPLAAADANDRLEMATEPYLDPVRVSWLPVHDGQGRIVARYAYWLEDLQGKIDPGIAGNLAGPGLTHERAAYPFPAPGLNPRPIGDGQTALDQFALFALEPAATSALQGTLGKTLIQSRALLLSPGSTLAAAHVNFPLERHPGNGRLTDLTACAVEESLTAPLPSWLERPVLPFAPGIDPAVAGLPRLNLNALLAKERGAAIDEMAGFIRAALPDIEQRKGGFPEDYVKTLAANALDYADADSMPTLKAGEYRGIDACPMLSEVALQVGYGGISTLNNRHVMAFRIKLFAEFCNPTNKPLAGEIRLSYEVALPMDSIGSGVAGEPFDSPVLLEDPLVATHDLERLGNRYWTRRAAVALAPNQYRCYLLADVSYRLDMGAASEVIPMDTPFSLNESHGASGVSLMWNDQVVERTDRILRQAGLIYYKSNGVVIGGFRVGTPKTITKAALPGHVYEDYPNMNYYNMGDPRSTHYLRGACLDENAYPENSSPNRRNVRLEIYQNDSADKPKVYARMLPSEWPDGGHNCAVGAWSPGNKDTTEMTDAKFAFAHDPQMEHSAPQWISNAGRFFSVTELGRVFDPIMHAPSYPVAADTASLRVKGLMPATRTAWPDVTVCQPSPFYGGGNTLRIGRPEHPAFDPADGCGLQAAGLLDLFHAGLSRSEQAAQREGPLTRIQGHVNLNTASRDALRVMAAGALVMDPLLAMRTAKSHLGPPAMGPPVLPLELTAPTTATEADRIADAIIRNRPYHSSAGLAGIRDSNGAAVFGNRANYPQDETIEWSDAAAEEIFARVYEGATVRSRNFRVWVVAQALAPSVPGAAPEVLAEVRKVHTVFADPGERASDGSIKAGHCNTIITSSRGF